MSHRRIVSRLLNAMVLTVLVLSSMPVTGPALSQAPATIPDGPQAPAVAPAPLAPPPPGGALRLAPPADPPIAPPVAPPAAAPAPQAAEVEEASDASPAAPDAPDTCTNPTAGRIPMGQDLELLLGPSYNNATLQLSQGRYWSSPSPMLGYSKRSFRSADHADQPGPQEVLICGQGDCGGNGWGGCWVITPGQYNCCSGEDGFGLDNDKMSSIRTGSDVEVTLFKDGIDSGGKYFVPRGTSVCNMDSLKWDDGTNMKDSTSAARVAVAPWVSGNVAAAAVGTDSNIVLIKTLTTTGTISEVASMSWNAATGFGGFVRQGITASGNPVIVTLGNDVAYFVRGGPDGNQIKWRKSSASRTSWTDWSDLPDSTAPDGFIIDAASDPAVVATDLYHMKLFYKNSAGYVKLSEWDSGVGWRTAPVTLTLASDPKIASELSAVARDENHVAVFGVSATNILYVKQWSSANNKPDWSDTSWVQLATSARTDRKLAVAARHTGHVIVVYMSTISVGGGTTPWYREWTATRYQDYPNTSPRGWKAAASLGGGLDSVGLVATSSKEMIAYGVNTSGSIYVKVWNEVVGSTTGSWGGWSQLTGTWATGQFVAAAAGRPGDAMWYGRAASGKVESFRLTNVGATVGRASQANTSYGLPRAQAIATVNARTVWVSAYRNGSGQWRIDAKDTATWSGKQITTTMAATTNTDANKVSVAAGDLDQDGDDEIIVSTLDTNAHKITTNVYKLTVTGSSVTAITQKASDAADYGTGVTLYDVNVDLGDLNGDGKKNEIAVVAGYAGYAKVYIRAMQYTGSSLVTKANRAKDIGNNPINDIEMAVGYVDGYPYEQIIVAARTSGYAPQMRVFRLDIPNQEFVQAYSLATIGVETTGAEGAYSTALAAGDVDSDGREEAVYTFGTRLFVVSVEVTTTLTGPYISTASTDATRSLAVGDVDGDGRAEIAYNHQAGTGWTGIFKLMDPFSSGPENYSTALTRVGKEPDSKGIPLLADLDGDSQVATYRSCQDSSEYRVVGVINSFPMYFYQDGTPALDANGGGIANRAGVVDGAEDGWSTTMGGSVSVGFKYEWSAPILAIKLGEVRASVTQEFMGSFGGGTETVSSTTETEGTCYGCPAFSIGAVCYTKTSYKCYTYDVGPANSTYTTTSRMCAPVQPAPDDPKQECRSIEDWYSTDPEIGIRDSAGDSWAPVGHHTTNSNTLSVNVAEYPVLPAPPVDSYLVWWQKKTKIPVGATGTPGTAPAQWSVEKGQGVTDIKNGSFEENTTVSAGFDAFVVTFDASFTAGYGKEWSSSMGWESGLEFSGDVYHYPTSTYTGTEASPCPTTVCTGPYAVVPFVYHATAHTKGGLTYSYLEQDYYRTAPPLASEAAAQDAQAVVGLTPQAPVVTSATHPDPATWYPTNTVTFNWSQPPGDQAVVIGYRWNLDHSPVATPTAMMELTTTQTYKNVPDGVYYLHIRAVGDAGDYGPVTHRAFHVDTGAPQVQFAPIPFVPNGSNGWYNTPITFAVTATDNTGSGIAGIETSEDGTTWLPYTPIYITANTPGRTLWARATDNLGHVSDIISTTFKLDQTPPSVRDSDRYGLSYARIITDEVGNAQLVLGGALSDTLSGRLQVEVKAGETGAWNAVSAVGDLPMPPGNWFSTTMTGLQWMYTPTFEIRGAYPLYVRGVDMAGNYGQYYSNTLIMPGGCFWWDPVAEPALDESRVSVSPHQANPGDVLAFTVAARDSGYQEAQYLITDTVPAGLTVVPGSISEGGLYDAATRQIVWTLHAAWPGQTHYLFFNATVDGTAAPGTLENQLDLMAYWPWDRTCDPRVPPEPARYYYSTTTTLTVLAGASRRASAATANPGAPQIVGAAVVEGEIVGDPDVTLVVNASPEARYLYVKEWVWNGTLNMWSPARESGWVPFETAAGFSVSEDNIGKYGRYDWTLSEGDGVKYLGLWVADADGQTSNLNEGNLIHTNLVSASGQQLAAGQRVQYRVWMRADQLAVLALVSLSGDADLYVWKPRAGLKPHYYSNAAPTGGGLSLDTVGLYAGEEGLYVIEVQAATDATYRLVTAGDVAALEAQDEALPASTHLLLADKERPAHPLTLTTPFSLGDIEQLPTAPMVYRYYFPLIYKQ